MTKVKEDSKVSYSAIAGELRKSARLYEVFKHASEAADILASFEREKSNALSGIKNLQKELEDLDQKCDDSYNKLKESKEGKLHVENEALLILKKARVEAENIKSRASSNSEKKIAEGNDALELILEKTRIAKSDMEKSINKKNESLKSLSKVEEQMKAAKDKFLKTLG